MTRWFSSTLERAGHSSLVCSTLVCLGCVQILVPSSRAASGCWPRASSNSSTGPQRKSTREQAGWLETCKTAELLPLRTRRLQFCAFLAHCCFCCCCCLSSVVRICRCGREQTRRCSCAALSRSDTLPSRPSTGTGEPIASHRRAVELARKHQQHFNKRPHALINSVFVCHALASH